MSDTHYWDERYKKGQTSGLGTHHGDLKQFKIDTINNIIDEYNINSIYDIGCGDGHQIKDLNPNVRYTGTDISPTSIKACSDMYKHDANKIFIDYTKSDTVGEHDMSMSLDVIYHITDDTDFFRYLEKLLCSKIVLIYSSNFDNARTEHVRHRKFTDHIKTHKLIKTIEHGYEHLSSASFYLYLKECCLT